MTNIFSPSLSERLRNFQIINDSDMPWAYQRANPAGRPLHDDWGLIPEKLPAWVPEIIKTGTGKIQFYRRWKRIDNAYRVPLPFKVLSGKTEIVKRRWHQDSPLSPGHEITWENDWSPIGPCVTPHIEHEQPLKGGGVSVSGFWNGSEWVPCFWQYSKKIGDRHFLAYYGLKQDLTVDFFADGRLKSDLMGWYPEASLSLKRW